MSIIEQEAPSLPTGLEDVQNRRDRRGIPINKVGVSDLRYPILVLDRAQQWQHTVAHVSLSVALPHHFKGTHMSRFVEVLNKHRGEITMRTLPAILRELRERLDAEQAHIDVKFPYFLERTAPVSGASALMDYRCAFAGESNGDTDEFVLSVEVPVTSLCPCSKEISDYGAHNQRGYVSVQVRGSRTRTGEPELIWIEEIIEIAEAAASAPVYPLLKRPDERHVTMQAFDKPAFVEDIVRDVAMQLRDDSRVEWFRVHVVNQESIHNHSAFAEIEWTRTQIPVLARTIGLENPDASGW
jgi:GTP cyclohydrolase IB